MSFAEFDTNLRSTSLTKIAEREENGRNGKVRVKGKVKNFKKIKD